jgi:hypothetical protein
MPDVIGAFVGHEESQGRRHQLADLVERPRTCGAEERFQFGEGQFDGIEVGTVGREKAQERPGLLNRQAHRGLLVDSEVVEDDDITPPERGREDLLDVGVERGVVDRAIEDSRRSQLRGAERGDHRVRFPVAAGGVIGNAGPPRASCIPA